MTPRTKATIQGQYPADPIWTKLDPEPFPAWLERFRPHQVRAAREVTEHFEDGRRVVFMDAPVGSGKSIVGDMVRRLWTERAVYLCTTISLQQQLIDSFPYARLLKGRANYPTLNHPEGTDLVSCADCDVSGSVAEGDASCSWCSWVEACPYKSAKQEALGASLTVLNMAYFLAEANYQGGFSRQELVIVDESTLSERQIMGFVGLEIGPAMCKKLKVTVPKKGSHMPTIRAWLDEEVREAIVRARGRLGGGLEDARERTRLERLMGQIGKVVAREDGWVRDSGDEERAKGGLVLKPVKVDDVAEGVLWQHGAKWLCMDGTIVSAEMEAESLGLSEDEWTVVSVPMGFAVENRPIYYSGVATNTRREQENGAREKIARAVGEIVEARAQDKVLVHAVSYELTRMIVREIGANVGVKVFWHTDARGRQDALDAFMGWDGGAVLVSPSMDRGVDLKDDLARVVVICKVPYLNLGDRQVSERLHEKGGQLWMTVQTMRSLVQMVGRGVRSEEDWAETWVLDASFGKLWREWKGLLPGWFREAVEVVPASRISSVPRLRDLVLDPAAAQE